MFCTNLYQNINISKNFKQQRFPSITGLDASGPISPIQNRRTISNTATKFFGIFINVVYILAISRHGSATWRIS
jgi:hypothetical protein